MPASLVHYVLKTSSTLYDLPNKKPGPILVINHYL